MSDTPPMSRHFGGVKFYRPRHEWLQARFHSPLVNTGRMRRADKKIQRQEAQCGLCGQEWDSCTSEMLQWELVSMGWWRVPRSVLETCWCCPHCLPTYVRVLRWHRAVLGIR